MTIANDYSAAQDPISDAELDAHFMKLAEAGTLTSYIVELLESGDLAGLPDVEVNGTALKLDGGLISDKSCYKKCLKEDVRNPGSYAKCIKKCKPKSKLRLSISFGE
ncbi:hypothetical protein [Ferrimonas balearica]|uniref:hypothetical protein n=1 Tax=Ferrimonas balearica TaxID=44012 RepID=UPI001C990C5F|nr:hypothetical protein [Ferrimonas balearica]MBY5991320.1 hypothetical protein [Ferrimonas balearica]